MCFRDLLAGDYCRIINICFVPFKKFLSIITNLYCCFQMQRLNFCISSSSRRCNQALQCRSSASRWATLRRTSPGRWTGFLFRKTTGRTSIVFLARDFLLETKEQDTVRFWNLICQLFYPLFCVQRMFITQKIDGRCTRRLFAVINPEVLHEIVGKSVWKQQFPSDV